MNNAVTYPESFRQTEREAVKEVILDRVSESAVLTIKLAG